MPIRSIIIDGSIMPDSGSDVTVVGVGVFFCEVTIISVGVGDV